jgi:hypothetical protein
VKQSTMYKKVSYRMGENIYKSFIWYRFKFPNLWGTLKTQWWKQQQKNQFKLKLIKGLK